MIKCKCNTVLWWWIDKYGRIFRHVFARTYALLNISSSSLSTARPWRGSWPSVNDAKTKIEVLKPPKKYYCAVWCVCACIYSMFKYVCLLVLWVWFTCIGDIFCPNIKQTVFLYLGPTSSQKASSTQESVNRIKSLAHHKRGGGPVPFCTPHVYMSSCEGPPHY